MEVKNMVFDKVKEIVAERLDVADDQITMEAVITDDLGADSLDVVDLVMDLEDAFSIEIPDEAMADIKTIGDIVAYIERETK
jgi:acyl carrier protein